MGPNLGSQSFDAQLARKVPVAGGGQIEARAQRSEPSAFTNPSAMVTKRYGADPSAAAPAIDERERGRRPTDQYLLVVGRGIDPRTSRFSGARSTN